jgi:hypothetical protein
VSLLVLVASCASTSSSPPQAAVIPDGGVDASTVPDAGADADTPDATGGTATLPLVKVADVDLPGKPVRFDYQDFDPATGNLVIAHMNDASVVVVKASDGSVVKVVSGIPTARGVVVAPDVGRVFVTSSPNKLVILDSASFSRSLGSIPAPRPMGSDGIPRTRSSACPIRALAPHP